jgi:hypothetical protein
MAIARARNSVRKSPSKRVVAFTVREEMLVLVHVRARANKSAMQPRDWWNRPVAVNASARLHPVVVVDDRRRSFASH